MVLERISLDLQTSLRQPWGAAKFGATGVWARVAPPPSAGTGRRLRRRERRCRPEALLTSGAAAGWFGFSSWLSCLLPIEAGESSDTRHGGRKKLQTVSYRTIASAFEAVSFQRSSCDVLVLQERASGMDDRTRSRALPVRVGSARIPVGEPTEPERLGLAAAGSQPASPFKRLQGQADFQSVLV